MVFEILNDSISIMEQFVDIKSPLLCLHLTLQFIELLDLVVSCVKEGWERVLGSCQNRGLCLSSFWQKKRGKGVNRIC